MHKQCSVICTNTLKLFNFKFDSNVEHKLSFALRFLTTLIFELPRFLLVVSSFNLPYVSEFVISALLIWLFDWPKLFAQFQSIEIESLRWRQKIRFCWRNICPLSRFLIVVATACLADCWRRMAATHLLHLQRSPTTVFLTLKFLWLQACCDAVEVNPLNACNNQ
jgi:hypothetical protein